MTYLQLWRLLTMHWRVTATFALLGALLALAWALIAAPTYEATAQIIINVRAPETLGASSPSATDQLLPDYLSTQIDIIKSDRIARLLVERLQLGGDGALLKSLGWTGRGSLEDFLARRINRPLKVAPSSLLSRVVDIRYRASDPQFAATAANAFAQSYVDAALDLQAQPARDSAAWYQRRLSEVQRGLAQAQARLSTRQRELGISSGAGQADPEDIRLQGLTAQIAAVQTADAAARSRATGGALPAITADPVIGNLQVELAKLEAQRAQLSATAGPNNPDVKQVTGQIAALQRQISEQKARLSESAQATAQQASRAVSNLTAAAEAQKKRTIEARTQHDEIGVLEQDVRNLQTVYEQMAARRSQLDLLGGSTQSNVAILSKATPPDRPIWPNALRMLIGGIVVGAAFGFTLVIARELVDQRMRASSDYEAWLGIPDLGRLRLDLPRSRGLIHQGMALLPFHRSGE